MILELRKNGKPSTEGLLKSFDCSWLSRFGEEREHLLFAGRGKVVDVESVRLMATNQGFGAAFEAMRVLDRMLQGQSMKTPSMGTISARTEVVDILKPLLP